MQNMIMDKLQSNRLKHFPNISSLLKISLGLILLTLISTALVYAETISVDVEGTSFDVDYAATGVTVNSIEADLDFTSLILTVDVPDSGGTLDIMFERSFFDSTFEGLDEEFFVLVDQDEGTFTETNTIQSRTLHIDLPSGTEEIEIIGSSFGEPVSIPVEEKPVVTPPKVEEKPVVTPPKVQCGPGTVLKDGVCALDERCGPGTVLKDGVCVLDSTTKPYETSSQGVGKEMIIAVIAAFVIAGSIGIILALISKASKSKN